MNAFPKVLTRPNKRHALYAPTFAFDRTGEECRGYSFPSVPDALAGGKLDRGGSRARGYRIDGVN